jgi:hypothetical protein
MDGVIFSMQKTVFLDNIKQFKNRDDKSVYNLADFDKAVLELEKEHVMKLPELILILFYAQKEQPIKGMILLMKEIFLMQMEFAKEEKIKIQDANFISYKYGPYSVDVDKVIESMEIYGLIISKGRKSSNKEIFYLTDYGKKRAKEQFEKLNTQQQLKLKDLRKGWDQLGVKGILKYVYSNYQNFIDKSEIKKQVLKQKEVYRMRG